jgi:two-component system alkaline phosphatase synthesis response regulator PhoP
LAKIFIIADEGHLLTELRTQLSQQGHRVLLYSPSTEVIPRVRDESPALVLLEVGSAGPDGLELARLIKKQNPVPVIALLDEDVLFQPRLDLGSVDDFLVAPANGRELFLRISRILKGVRETGEEIIRADDLVIDSARCEVLLAGQPVMLTYREYELLKFLARDRGRVFTREALLDKVWGYDYYGGDRTVDVHIRRLREKIEDQTHTFIETVRNIGYRFRE